MRLICKRPHLKPDSLFALALQHFTFIAHALHFVDGLLAVLLSQVLGLFHRLAQEFFKLSSEAKYNNTMIKSPKSRFRIDQR